MAEPPQEYNEVMVAEPDKVMRIGRMISRLLDEVKQAPLDEASRYRMREIYDQSIESLAGVLEDRLALELIRITTPFAEGSTPSESELRIAQAQLVGWLEGLFQGMQTALLARHLQTTLSENNTRAVIPTTLSSNSQSGIGTYL